MKEITERLMKTIGYVVLAAAAAISLTFIRVLKPTSFGAVAFFTGWLLLPYVALALVLVFWTKDRIAMISGLVVVVLVTAGGLLFLTQIIFINPDPQGGIAVLFTPIYQAVGISYCHYADGYLANSAPN